MFLRECERINYNACFNVNEEENLIQNEKTYIFYYKLYIYVLCIMYYNRCANIMNTTHILSISRVMNTLHILHRY